jgi:hypothetical protein
MEDTSIPEECKCKMFTKEFEECPYINKSVTSCSIYEKRQAKEKNLAIQAVLRVHLRVKADKEAADGGDIFMGIPDRWYDKLTFVCQNGHISSMCLKSEALGDDVCMSCHEHIFICPPETTTEEIQELLANPLPCASV